MKKKINNPITNQVWVINDYEEGFSHEYDLISDTDNDITYVHRSFNTEWEHSCRGEKVGYLKDDGNNVMLGLGGKEIFLDYAQLEVLTALIMNYNEFDVELRESKVTKKLSSNKFG